MFKAKERETDIIGVSEVIAVILMVAITVVLAGVLYVWVMGMSSTSEQEMATIGITYTGLKEGYYTWEVASISGVASISDTTIKVKSPDGGVKQSRDLSTLMIPPPLTRGDDGLELYYKFDEGSGSTVSDSSLNNNVGTITGAIWSPNARGGTSLLFDGNDRVDVPLNNTLEITGPVTLEAWIYPTASGSSMHIIQGAGQYVLWIQSNGKIRLADTHGHYVDTDTNVLTLNSWNHVVGIFAGSSGDAVNADNAFIYVNGVSKGKYYGGTWSPTALTSVRIGQSFKGNIDEARIYSRVISPAEVSYHAQMGNNIILIDNNADGFINQGDVIKVDANVASTGDIIEIYVNGAKVAEGEIM